MSVCPIFRLCIPPIVPLVRYKLGSLNVLSCEEVTGYSPEVFGCPKKQKNQKTYRLRRCVCRQGSEKMQFTSKTIAAMQCFQKWAHVCETADECRVVLPIRQAVVCYWDSDEMTEFHVCQTHRTIVGS